MVSLNRLRKKEEDEGKEGRELRDPISVGPCRITFTCSLTRRARRLPDNGLQYPSYNVPYTRIHLDVVPVLLAE